MDQHQDMTGLSLPQPSVQGQFSAPAQNPVNPMQAPPMQLQPPVMPSAPMAAPASNFMPAPPVALNQPAQALPVQPIETEAVSQSDLDDEALDAEWVQKAKAIVEQTHNDPYAESNALRQVKVDYLKRRYGKELKS